MTRTTAPSPSRPPMRLLLVLALAALAGCDALSFRDEPFTKVDPTPAAFTIDLAESDTVGLWGTASVRFRYQGSPVGPVEVYLNGDLVATGAGEGPFQIETAGLADGAYPLRVVVVAGSGTGSLADRLGRETITAEVERVAVVDNAPPEPVDLVSARVEDGLLSLRWEPYGRHNFSAYVVRRDGGFYPATQHRTDDRGQTAWADPSYLGGRRMYQVALEAGGQVVVGEGVEVDHPIPTFAGASRMADGRGQLAWHPTPFTGAFKAYRLVPMGFPNSATVAYNEAVDDTVAVDDARDAFGLGTWYALTTLGRGGVEVTSHFRVFFDPASPLHGPVVSASTGGTVFGVEVQTGQPALYEAATLKRHAVASLPELSYWLALAVSPSGRLAVLDVTRRRAYELDRATLAVIRQIDLRHVATATIEVAEWSRVLLTDDGVLYMGFAPTGITPRDSYPYLLAVDLDTGEVVGRFGQDEGDGAPRRPVAVSADGRYLVAGDRDRYDLYERDAARPSGFRRVRALPGISDAQFAGPDRLAVLAEALGSVSRQARILAVPSLEPVADLGRPASDVGLRVDILAKRALVLDGGADRARIYDSITGAEVADIEADIDSGTWGTPEPDFSLAGGAVWNRGRYRRLP